jgi:[ribosomal protein S5]-alanine N-acetyltransferase
MEFPRVTLSTDRLLLRPFTADDAPDVHTVWNDEAYLRFAPAGLPVAGADLDLALDWCTNAVERHRQTGQALSLAAARADTGRLVGHVALFQVDWSALTTEIHYWTAPWARGNRFAPEAVRAVAGWALSIAGFARVTLQAVVENVASQRVARAAGFRFEGVLRNAALTRAGRGDFAMYSLIPDDLKGHHD